MQLLCDMGTTQAVVLMPLHPRLLAAVRGAGWQKRHDEVMTYPSGLQGRYGFGLLDRSHLATFNGDPQQFYDGFHVKRANARKLTRNVVAELPSAFAAVAGTRPFNPPARGRAGPRPREPAAAARARARAGRSRPHPRTREPAAVARTLVLRLKRRSSGSRGMVFRSVSGSRSCGRPRGWSPPTA